MFNIHLHLQQTLIQFKQYFPNIEHIQLKHYQFGLSDYGVMYSGFLEYIIQHVHHLKMIFYTFDVSSNQYQPVTTFDLRNHHDINTIQDFYFKENLQSKQFCYFYIIYDIHYRVMILSDDSLDRSLLLYQPNQIRKTFKHSIPDYFIMLDD